MAKKKTYPKNDNYKQPSLEGSGDKVSKDKKRENKFKVEVNKEPYEAIINVYGLIDKNGKSTAARRNKTVTVIDKTQYTKAGSEDDITIHKERVPDATETAKQETSPKKPITPKPITPKPSPDQKRKEGPFPYC